MYHISIDTLKMARYNLDKSDFSVLSRENPTYLEIRLTRTFVNSDQFPISLEGTT